jgi:hypothetical protein
MKNKEALGQKVFNICKREAKDFMNPDIPVRYFCEEIFGIGYMKSTKYQLEKSIKQSIQYAEKIAINNDEQLLTIMIPVEGKTKKTRIYGYKLQRPGDELSVEDQAHNKFEILKAKAVKLNGFAQKADEDHLLSEEYQKKIKIPELRSFLSNED